MVSRKKQKLRFMKQIVGFVIVANCLFSFGVLWVFYKIGAEPTTLIGFWFAFTTTELLSLAGIKKGEANSSNRGLKGYNNELNSFNNSENEGDI